MAENNKSDKRFRILSLDSGGIYGLFSMLMLRELRHDPQASAHLLAGGCIDLFAGTGAGAVNALILAKHDNPHDGIEEAIRFWRDERLYRNNPFLNMVENVQGWLEILSKCDSPQQVYEKGLAYWNDARTLHDPWTVMRDAMGMGSWFGAPDVMAVLQEHFADLRLRDLKQKVLVTAFNWSGDEDLPANERHWKPKVYCNFPDSDKDCDAMAAEVAFTALSWMDTLPIVNGEQGGGWYAPDPTLCAVAKVVNFVAEKLKPLNLTESWRNCVDGPIPRPLPREGEARREAAQALRRRVNAFFGEFIADAEDEAYRYLLDELNAAEGEGRGRVSPEGRELLAEAFPYFHFINRLAGKPGEVDARIMRHLSVLSLGNGVRVPFLPVETEEWGFGQWAMGMYNPATKQWIQPNQYASFQAPEQMAREQCQWLLNDPDLPLKEQPHRNRYHRLGPELFDTPVLTTIALLRNNPLYHAALVKEIEEGSSAAKSGDAYRETVRWMEAQGWFERQSWATHREG